MKSSIKISNRKIHLRAAQERRGDQKSDLNAQMWISVLRNIVCPAQNGKNALLRSSRYQSFSIRISSTSNLAKSTPSPVLEPMMPIPHRVRSLFQISLKKTQFKTLGEAILRYEDPHAQLHPQRTKRAVSEHVNTSYTPKVSLYSAGKREVPCT